MRAYFTDLWHRIEVHWHAVVLALIAATPSILDWLGVVDLKPILAHFMPEHVADFIVAILPFVLAFVRPMIVVAASKPLEEDE